MSEANPRGGLVALAAGGAAIVLVAVVGVVLALRSCGGDATAPAARGAAGNASVAEEGERAPGTAELRALGCNPAIVVDMVHLLGGASRVNAGEPRYMITCDVLANADPPACERVASVYFRAIGGTTDDPVGVRVLRSGAAAPACSHLYAPNGADLGVFPKPP
jgi:hypothetical protein